MLEALRRHLPPVQAGRKPAKDASTGATLETRKFRVIGVDKETEYDTTIVVDAATEANARVKAELRSVLVTAIERIA